MSAPIASRPLILVGTLQGGLLWWLWYAEQHHNWPATAPISYGALLAVVLAVPLAIYLSAGVRLPFRRRALLVGGVALAYAAMGAYAGWMGTPPAGLDTMIARPRPELGFGQFLAALAMGFMTIPLVAAWDSAARRWPYPQLFEQAWRNALLSASVGVLTGLFWAVLWAGAMLMNSLGLNFIRELISEPIFAFPVTGLVVGGIFAQGLARSDLLVNLRRFWLALNAWLLPLLLVFSVMWVLALPFTGLAPLFKTRAAAFILLWFTVLAVKFLNAAWQDGQERAAYPHWLAALVSWSWPTLVLVVGVAGWALYQRIAQYGLTEDRVWAAFIWLLAAGYALGYAASLLPGFRARGWMATVGPSNIAVALIALGGLALLMSPLADPRRLAVADQVARLHKGLVTPTEFDYDYLRFRAGRWGWQALQRLSTAQGDARVADIAGRARQALAQHERFDEGQGAKAVLNEADARARIRVLPAGTALDASLLAHLRDPGTDWRARRCLQPSQTCAVWWRDFNGDQRPEALLLIQSADATWTQSFLYEQQASGWTYVAEFGQGVSSDDWVTAIAQGRVQLAPPAWPDLVIEGQRTQAIVSSEHR